MHGVAGRVAVLRYLDATYQVLQPGDFVICAVTGRPIPLAKLRYWSVSRQEPYGDAEAALMGARDRDRGW